MTTPLRVLIVEDNPDDADLLLRELRRTGFEPISRRVDTSAAMREALSTDSWDIVISDYSMPAFSGTEAIQVLQASGKDVPFILVSGTVGEETAVGAMRAGASDYLLKDRLTRLGPAVKREIQEAEARRKHLEEKRSSEDQVLRQLEALTALYAGAQKLTQSLDLQTLASHVTRSIVEVFGATLAWIGQAQPDGRIRILAVYPDRSLNFEQIEIRWDNSPLGQGTSGRAIRSGFPVISNDTASDPKMAPWHDLLGSIGIRTVGAFPLTRRDTPFGALAICSDAADFFAPERTDLLQAYANQAAAALENARLFAETDRRLNQLNALRAIDLAITGSLDLRVTLNVLLDQATTQLQVDAAGVLLLDPHTQILEYAAGRGFRGGGLSRTRLPLGTGHAGRAAHKRRFVSIADLAKAGDAFTRMTLLEGEDFVSYAAVPLVAKNEVKGVLEIYHRGPLEFGEEWMQFLEALAGQAAIAIDNASLVRDLQRANVDLTLAYDTTLEGWSRALDLRDKETEGHTQRVTEFTLQLAKAMGVPEEEMPQIRRGALLHDIGKMGIPDSILLKPGPLTPEEWVIMKKHPVFANELLMPISYLRPALDIPFYHHEKWDGTGYPQGLRGQDIPLAARIFAVADVWDAITSDRPYRPAWSKEKAVAHIREQAGKHFDPHVVRAFLRLVESAA